MHQMIPYATFDGNCREAMDFYKGALGAEALIMDMAGSPVESAVPDHVKKGVLHATLVKNGKVLMMAADMPPVDGYKQGNDVTLFVICSSEEEVHQFFDKLVVGGQAVEPVRKQFWGDVFGALTDKFGKRWAFNYGKSGPIEYKD